METNPTPRGNVRCGHQTEGSRGLVGDEEEWEEIPDGRWERETSVPRIWDSDGRGVGRRGRRRGKSEVV